MDIGQCSNCCSYVHNIIKMENKPKPISLSGINYTSSAREEYDEIIPKKDQPAESASTEIPLKKEVKAKPSLKIQSKKPFESQELQNGFHEDKYSGLSLFNFEFSELPKLIDPIFPTTGLVSLVGSSDTGKSTFLRQLGLSIALGINDFVGYEINSESRNVIYVSSEDDAISTSISIKKQISGLSKLYKFDFQNLNHIKFIFDSDDNELDSLEKRLENILETTRVSLIIIDAFTDVFGFDINSSTAVRNFFKAFSSLSKKYNCLILFLHHTGKGKDKTSVSKDNVLGSQAFEAKMRILLELRKHPNNEDLRTLTITKGNYISSSIKKYSRILKFDESTLLFSKVSDILTDSLTNMSKRVKNSDLVEKLVIDFHKEKMTIRAIETELNSRGHKISRGTVNNIIKKYSTEMSTE